MWRRFRLKKRWIVISLAALTIGGTQVVGAAGSALEAIAVKFQIVSGGQAVSLTQDPVVIDGSTYVPLRALSEVLGRQVEWDEWNQTIRLKASPTVEAVHQWKNPAKLGSTEIKEGGFSGLTHLPGDPADVFYTLADRGPNGEFGKDKLRTFPVDPYIPRIYKIRATGGSIEIVETIPLHLPEGVKDVYTETNFVTGVSNLKDTDEVPYDGTAATKLAYDPDGLDLEGIAYNPKDDTFWLSDEYRPSLVQVKRDGTIVGRYVPQGAKEALLAAGAKTELYDTLPAVYGKRVSNRGFEGVAISPDGQSLYASIQSPLANPDKKTSDASRNLRILKLDLATKQVVGEYVYVAEQAGQLVNVAQKDIVISDLSALDTNVLLVDERDKNVGKDAQLKRIYKADFSKATNVLGTAVSDSLESLSVSQLKEKGIVPVAKEMIVDMTKLGYPYEKMEGITAIGKDRIAIVNDNDFGVDGYNDKGELQLMETPSEMYVVKLNEPLY